MSAARRPLPESVYGFTAIELLIVTTIVGILAIVAYNSYAAEMRRSARAELQSLVTTAATRQSQFLVDRRRYAESLDTLGMSLPPAIASKYTVAVVANNDAAPRYTITATAVGAQASDKCPLLSLDSAGNRAPAGCW